MKNLKKIFIVMLVTIMATTILVSCGEPKVASEESAKIYLDVILKDDKTNMEKIGMKEEDYTNYRKSEDDELMQQLGMNGVSDEIKATLKDNIYKGLSKLEYEVTPVSIDKDTAKVNVKINYFSLKKIIASCQEKIKEKVTANPSMTQEQILQESFKLIGEEFEAGPAADDSTTIETNLKKVNNIWVPDENFGKDVSKVIISVN